MTKQYYGVAVSVFLLGLFPVFFLPVLQLMVLIMSVGLVAAYKQLDRNALRQFLNWRYVVFMQFCIFFFINAAVYSVWDSPRMHYRAVALESWGMSLLCLGVLVLWLHVQKASDIKRALIVWLPIGLTVSFFIATFFYVSGIQGTRIPLFTPSPLTPPLWFLVCSVTCFTWFPEMKHWEKIWRLGLFLMAGVMAIYGEARLVLLAWILCGCILPLWLCLQIEKKQRPRLLLRVGSVFLICLASPILLDFLTGGKMLARMAIFSQVELTYESISSKFLRLRIWTGALSLISENVLFGIGQVNERIALQQEMDWDRWLRAHQTYLSYLIAGGVPALISGLLMQSSVLTFMSTTKRSVFSPAFFGLGVVITLNCLTDSIFQSAVSVQVFIVVTLFYLRASDADHPTLVPQKHVSPAIT